MAGPRPKVTIGLPVHNGQDYLEEALDCLLAQTYTDFELILADNASTDRTAEICLHYARKDPRIRFHRNQHNIGAAPNHNLLVRMAKGEYFKWGSYDDRLSPEFLSRCVATLDHQPHIVLCMTESGRIDQRGQYEGPYELPVRPITGKRLHNFRRFALWNRSGNFVYGLMRTEILRQTSLLGSFPSSDLVLLAELALYGDFELLPEILFFRRSHPRQSTKGSLGPERARAVWMDTSLSGRILFPKWLALVAFLRAVQRAPLSTKARIYCYMQVLHWSVIWRNLRGLIKDLLWAAWKLLLQSRPVSAHKVLSQSVDR